MDKKPVVSLIEAEIKKRFRIGLEVCKIGGRIVRPKRYPYSRNQWEKKTTALYSGDNREHCRKASVIMSDKISSNYIDASKIIMTK